LMGWAGGIGLVASPAGEGRQNSRGLRQLAVLHNSSARFSVLRSSPAGGLFDPRERRPPTACDDFRSSRPSVPTSLHASGPRSPASAPASCPPSSLAAVVYGKGFIGDLPSCFLPGSPATSRGGSCLALNAEGEWRCFPKPTRLPRSGAIGAKTIVIVCGSAIIVVLFDRGPIVDAEMKIREAFARSVAQLCCF